MREKDTVNVSRSNQEQQKDRKVKLRCLSQSHWKSLWRGSEVMGEVRLVMKRDINIALSQARLSCENGLQFVHQYNCQAISLSPSGKYSIAQTGAHIHGKKKKILKADNEATLAWCCICNMFIHA